MTGFLLVYYIIYEYDIRKDRVLIMALERINTLERINIFQNYFTIVLYFLGHIV